MSGFLKLEGIFGETSDSKHRGEFDIEEVQFGYDGVFSYTPIPEKTSVIKVKRRYDKDSGKLFAGCCAGTIFPTGKITLSHGNSIGNLTMTKVSIQTYDSFGYSQDATESILLLIEKFSFDNPKLTQKSL